jgi:hypothetical protein
MLDLPWETFLEDPHSETPLWDTPFVTHLVGFNFLDPAYWAPFGDNHWVLCFGRTSLDDISSTPPSGTPWWKPLGELPCWTNMVDLLGQYRLWQPLGEPTMGEPPSLNPLVRPLSLTPIGEHPFGDHH